MSALLTLNEADLEKFIVEFYAQADASAPLLWFLPYIDENLKMHFGPISFEGQAGFEEFYRNLTGNQFNRVHKVSNFKVKVDGDTADITFTIHVTSKAWYPPQPKSLRMENQSELHLIMKMSPKTGLPVITNYDILDLQVPEGAVLIDSTELFKYQTYVFGPWKYSA